MNEEMKKLELQHIAGYLPYGLIGIHAEGHICKIGLNNAVLEGTGYLPALIPESDLTKPIRQKGYKNGEEFVPIVELGRLLGMLEPLTIHDMTDLNGKKRGIAVVDRFDNQHLHYVFQDKEGVLFSFWHKPHGYDTAIPTLLDKQIELFDLLNQWLIDYRGLIPAGLAKSVYDLKENPYE